MRATALILGAMVDLKPDRARARILAALKKTNGDAIKAARRLKVSVSQFYVFLGKLGLLEQAQAMKLAHKNRFRLPPRQPE